jgi:hypothetical protein
VRTCPFRSSIVVAALIGFLAAIPIALIIGTDPAWVDSPWARLVAMPAAALCPPWWLFWLVLGRPDDLQFFFKLCGMAIVLNAVIYAPVGIVHQYGLRLRPAKRWTLVVSALALMLAAGHAFFMAEPDPLVAVVEFLAA